MEQLDFPLPRKYGAPDRLSEVPSRTVINLIDLIRIKDRLFVQRDRANAETYLFRQHGVRRWKIRAHHFNPQRMNDCSALRPASFQVFAEIVMVVNVFIDVAGDHPISATTALFPAAV